MNEFFRMLADKHFHDVDWARRSVEFQWYLVSDACCYIVRFHINQFLWTNSCRVMCDTSTIRA